MADSMKRKRKVLGLAIRLLIAVALVGWLLHSGKLDPAQIKTSVQKEYAWVGAAAGLYALAACISMVRWWTLLAAQGVRLRASDTIQLSFIGFLFCTFIPGGVTGDVVKGYYIARETHNKTGAVMSILLDRVLGLSTFIALAAIAMLAWMLGGGLDRLDALPHHKMKIVSLAVAVFVILAAVLTACFVLLNRRLRSSQRFNRFLDRLPGSARLRAIYDAVFLYRDNPGHLAAAIALSFGQQMTILLAHYCLGIAAGATGLTFKQYMILGALGMLANAIPLGPMGIGSGQVAYAFLFKAFGSTGSAGTTVITLLQAIMIAWNQIGWIFYLIGRSKYHIDAASAVSEADSYTMPPSEEPHDNPA